MRFSEENDWRVLLAQYQRTEPCPYPTSPSTERRAFIFTFTRTRGRREIFYVDSELPVSSLFFVEDQTLISSS